MSLLTVLLEVVAPIAVVVGLAALVGRTLHTDPRPLSQLVIYLFTPFLLIGGASSSTLGATEIVQIALLALLVTIGTGAAGWLAARWLGLGRQATSAFLLTVIFMNSGNFGLPLNEFAFGSGGLERAIVWFVAMTVVTNTLGVFLASWGRVRVREALLDVLRVPMLYAIVAGLAVSGADIALPLPVQRVTTLLGDAAIPAMLVILGLQLAAGPLRGRWRVILTAATLRLLLSPLILLGAAWLIGIGGLTLRVTLLQSAMPAAVFNAVLATEFGGDAELATAIIAVTTLLSFVTLTLLLALTGSAPVG